MHLAAACVLVWLAAPAPARAQEPENHGPLRVFLDCGRCDFDFVRREIPFVDYVRDPKEAEVHILVTTQPTASGGTEFLFQFIGLGRFAGVDDEARYTASQLESYDEQRQGYTRIVKLGLVRYVISTKPAENLQLIYRPPGAPAGAGPAAVNDRWDFWVFRIRGNGSVNGEESNSAKQLSTFLSANRTTEAWKLNVSASLNYRVNRYTLSDGENVRDEYRDHSFGGIAAKSLGPHWAAAMRARVSASTYLNQDRAARAAAGFEYNVFPYAESSRRQLTIQVVAGINSFRYHETTIYGKNSETVGDGVLLASFDVRKPWGSSGVSFEASSYFHDPGRHRVVVDGDIDIRLFKGFSVNVGASASRVHDQLYLKAGEATDEEILLRRRQLATAYRYRLQAGISYTFGSIFNNIVNPRFREGR